jgi:hypothetical protein
MMHTASKYTRPVDENEGMIRNGIVFFSACRCELKTILDEKRGAFCEKSGNISEDTNRRYFMF